jgi:alpha-tubulin suppressor-like RCC1 family protein
VHSLAGRRATRTQRRGSTLILAAIIAALAMAIAAPAQAAPNVAQAWGFNSHGELGNGTETETSAVPVAVSGLSGVAAIAGGFNHSLALLEGGTLMAWGSNSHGQLGNGTTKNSNVPVPVSGLSGVTAISAGSEHNLALLSNGTVMAWGANGSGQLGNGTTENSDVPVAVSGLSSVVGISAGSNHSLAVLSNGTVVAWGRNSFGQLGDATTENSDVPVAVSGLSGVVATAGGDAYSLALRSNGTVMAWGENEFGELGDGTTNPSDVPVEVSNLTGVSAISAGGKHSLALSNGTVRAWGDNVHGELGDATSTGPETCGSLPPLGCSKIPVSVSGLKEVRAISAGKNHSLALLGDGTVRAWGSNGSGQLGDGTSTGPEPCGSEPCSTKPVEVSNLGDVKGIGAGAAHSLAFGPTPPPSNLPEVGRCVKVATGTGKYSGGGCLALATKPTTKKYEWMPAGFTEKLAFSGSGAETTLMTVGHPTIKCLAANFSGEWTGPKTASVNVEFQACTNAAGAQCTTVTNPNNKSEILLKGVLGELGFIHYEAVEGKVVSVVGLDLKPYPPGNPSLAEYECTGSSEKGHLEGSVIGKLTPINKMTTAQKLLYYATKAGEQHPEQFQFGPKDTLTTSFTEGLPEESKGSGASSLNIKTESGNNAAPLEIKAK